MFKTEKGRKKKKESSCCLFGHKLACMLCVKVTPGLFCCADCKKSAAELAEEQALLGEVMKVVEERDRLVSLLEEQRLQEKAEDHDLESLILSKGYQFHWS